MPRSRRNKIVALTKTSTKGRNLKTKLVEVLRSHVDEYSRMYLFTFANMRTAKFRDVRMDWKESKIFMGKNSVTQIAFGRTPEEEYKDNLRQMSKLMDGNVGTLFTNRPHEEVVAYFNNFVSEEYANAGDVPSDDVKLMPGLLDFPGSMQSELRRLGLIVDLDDGKLILREPFYAAQEGKPLTAEQAKLLVKLGVKLSTFTIQLTAKWEDGDFQEL